MQALEAERQGLGQPQHHNSFLHLAELAMAVDESLTDPKSLSFEITRYNEEEDEDSKEEEESISSVGSEVSPLHAPRPPPPRGMSLSAGTMAFSHL